MNYTQDFLKERGIKVKHIRNAKNVPIATIATEKLSDHLFHYGLSLCSIKDSPNKKRGRTIAVGRLLSKNRKIILGGKRGKTFEKRLKHSLLGHDTKTKDGLWEIINGIKQL